MGETISQPSFFDLLGKKSDLSSTLMPKMPVRYLCNQLTDEFKNPENIIFIRFASRNEGESSMSIAMLTPFSDRDEWTDIAIGIN